MRSMKKSVIAMLLVVCMMFGVAACGGGNDTPDNTGKVTEAPQPTKGEENPDTPDPTTEPDGPKEIKTIRWGTHWAQGLDPWFVDETTGEYVMDPLQREARIAAEEAVMEELGVKIEYVQYAGNTTEVLLQSVMANDPICDIALLWGGSEAVVLGQNICQQLDDYAHIFTEDEDVSWMLYDKMFGHYYLLGQGLRFIPHWPLVYNITLVEAVDSLKDENGKTIYPNQLFDEGKWTWSTFKDYMAKIQAHYENDDAIVAYDTDFRFAALSAAMAAGGGIYSANGLDVTSDATKDAVAFIKSMIDEGTLRPTYWEDSGEPKWTAGGERFVFGTTVFTDIPGWFVGWAAGEASNRNQSIGIVPWPRPDDMAFDDPEYRQINTVADSICIPKGIDKETTELALRTLALYQKTYYCTLAEVDTVAEYQDAYAMQDATNQGIDIFHEEVGDSILASYQYLTKRMGMDKDYSGIFNIRGEWDKIVQQSIFGINGMASYDVAIEANLGKFDEVVNEMTAVLSQEGIVDNINPSVNFVKEPVAVPAGTKMTDAIWEQYITAYDNGLPMTFADFKPEFNTPETDSNVTVAYTEADLATPGYYDRMFKANFVDPAGNVGYKTVSVYVYDPNNTTAPTVTLVEEPAKIALNTDVSTINWKDYVATATDADGLDVKSNIAPDLSELDAATPGTYNVNLTVTDFAGNSTVVTVTVTVE